MKTKEIIYCVVIAILILFLLSLQDRVREVEQYVVDSQHFYAENYTTQAGTNCMIVKISHAGTEELRRNSTRNLKMDYAVCVNDRGEAVIDTSYDNFINTVIAEYDEWRQ